MAMNNNNNNNNNNNKENSSPEKPKRGLFHLRRRPKKGTSSNPSSPTSSPSKQKQQQQSSSSSPPPASGIQVRLHATSAAAAASAETATKTNQNNTKNNNNKKDPLLMKKSWLAKTKFFQNMMESSFQEIDQDGSGDVDEKELYSGLLLIHLKLGLYAGPAACKPISRDKCHAVFRKMDTDGSGTLDKEEFEEVMMVLFGNVLSRVVIQNLCTVLIVPFLAKYLLDFATIGFGYMTWATQSMEQQFQIIHVLQVAVEHVWRHACHFWSSLLPWHHVVVVIPPVVYKIPDLVEQAWEAIPSTFWATLPLTLISTVLSILLVPWSLMKIDGAFQSYADKKAYRC